MPEQFVSYNPTQVGQGNNIVYQPVNQQYGQLFAQGLGRVAAQKAKAAKDAQEKEYKFKAPNIGSSAYIPNKVTGALENFNKKYTSMLGFSTSVDLQNQAALEGNQLKTDVAQLALGEEGYKKFDNDIINSTDPRLAKYPSIIGAQEKLKDLYKFIEEEESKVTDPTQKDAAAVRAAAIWHAQKRNAPRKQIKMTLNEALQGVDPYSKIGSDGSTLADANKPGFYVQQGTEKKYITEDNLNNVITSTQNNNAVLNNYIDNDFAKAGEEIYSKEDADIFVVENYYTDPNKKLDENRFATDEKYRNEVIEESYKKQKDAMKEKIRLDVLSKYGVTEEGLNELKKKTNYIQEPGAGSAGTKKTLSLVENEKAGVFATDEGDNHDSRSFVTATISNAPVLQFNPVSLTDATLMSNDSQKLLKGDAQIVPTNISKVAIVKTKPKVINGVEQKGGTAPLMIYTKDNKPFDGTFDDIRNNLGNYKIVDPHYILNTDKSGMKQGKGIEQIPNIDKIKNLIPATSLTSDPTLNPQEGFGLHFAVVDKPGDTGDISSGAATNQTSKTGSVLLIARENVAKNPLYQQYLAIKGSDGKPIGTDENGNPVLRGMKKFNSHDSKRQIGRTNKPKRTTI